MSRIYVFFNVLPCALELKGLQLETVKHYIYICVYI